jgi:hypothetical protein
MEAMPASPGRRSAPPIVFLIVLAAAAAGATAAFKPRPEKPKLEADSPEEDRWLDRLERLFDRIEDALRTEDDPALAVLWREAQERLLEDRSNHGCGVHYSWRSMAVLKRMKPWQHDVRSRVLRYYWARGEALCARLAADQAELASTYEELRALTREMVETDDKFAMPASDLLQRAAPYRPRAGD